MGRRVSIAPGEVRHVARLAGLEVPEADLARLAGELAAIVDYVGRLAELGALDEASFAPGPPRAALRDDVVSPVPLARPPATFAPDFRDGFFVVPRVPGQDEP
jgi:aspartyl-tRNA(Asn)/glutamyl-tRNA(Gln) amidotransferase subunit C